MSRLTLFSRLLHSLPPSETYAIIKSDLSQDRSVRPVPRSFEHPQPNDPCWCLGPDAEIENVPGGITAGLGSLGNNL